MNDTEEAFHPFKARKMKKKAVADEINAFKYYFKESSSACS